ncbi:heparinase II/III family protein [Ciceribacter sp. L1K22]|uniref:heparinase II/III family protein n=1 Tax=Ciceribacter sp. L1K22 TaxID=2820275 RepID=UPI001ABE4A99|nr:heparinase II/III family protein [Ciceribacter sp. L1K22]MBO3758250.1 heparinase II/III family protein [Ciceribacter sp. L1K22]
MQPRLRLGSWKRTKLLVAPTDLRAIDPFVAEEIMLGRFPLAGRILEVGEDSPFAHDMPSELFSVRLQSFSWLRHIRSSKDDECRGRTRFILDDWIDRYGSWATGGAWEPDVAAQRLIAWLSHSPIVLQGADAGFYRRFLSSVYHHVRYLDRMCDFAPDGLPRFRARIALAFASIAMENSASSIRRASRALDREIERQILPDGGHISRNPQAAVELLLDLLPLRQTYINLGHEVPNRLIPAIDRMFPAIRFFRHQGGDLALFNGATLTLANDLMAVLRYDETAGQPFKALPHSQFQRLSAGDTVIITDVGRPLSDDLSRVAHAGCLSFEMSSGRQRFIVNCGSPRFAGSTLREIARETAAHSTVILGDRSSCRISRSDFLGPIFVDGVREVDVNRQTGTDGSDRLLARHDGYLGRYGVLHEREIRLSADGNKIIGRDRILLPDREPATGVYPEPALARFHVHPSVTCTQLDEQTIRLDSASGGSWTFKAIAGTAALTEDVFFADASGTRPSEQIELTFLTPEIVWSFTYSP